MLKLFSRFLKIFVTLLVINGIFLLHGMEQKAMEPEETKKQLMALYNRVVNQQKESIPGRKYQEFTHTMFLDLVKDVLLQHAPLINAYYKAFMVPPGQFSQIFFSHNIQVFAYQLYKFGDGDPASFRNKTLFVEGENPFLLTYDDPGRGPVPITTYSFFHGMLDSLNVIVQHYNQVLKDLNEGGIRYRDTQDGSKAAIVTGIISVNVGVLKTNLLKAANILSTEDISSITAEMIRLGELRVLNLINQIFGTSYAHDNYVQTAPDNRRELMYKIENGQAKKGQVRLVEPSRKPAITLAPASVSVAQKIITAPNCSVAQKIVTTQPNSTSWWKMATYALGATAATAVLAGLIYKLKPAPSSAVLPITIKVRY